MALHKKHEKASHALARDIMVIQEMLPRNLSGEINRTEGWSSAWFGKNLNKGLARMYS